MNSLTLKRPQTVPNDPKSIEKKETTRNNENNWKTQVWSEINKNNELIDRSDRNIFIGKHDDPLTNLRDVLRTLSNKEAFKYMRQCRLVVAKLKKCWVDVNEEVKALAKSKEYLESGIDHIRKDIIINQEIIDGRIHKAAREPAQDSVDDQLVIEKQNLNILKKNLDIMLKPLQDQSFKLDEIRERVFKLCRERSVVTDLICQCLTQSIRTYDKALILNKSKTTLLNSSLSKSHQSFTDRNNELENHREIYDQTDLSTNSSIYHVGPLSAFTAESIEIIKVAAKHIDESKELRMKSNILIKECLELSKKNSKSVDDQFVKKIADTLALSQNLGVNFAENGLAQNRAARWQELSEVALGYSLGPEKSTNLQTYEQISRPIIKNFQKHPGNQVGEVNQIIQGSNALSKSVATTQKQIKALKIIGQRLNSNMKDKEVQFKLDNSLLRRRRELSNHQWTPVKYIK